MSKRPTPTRRDLMAGAGLALVSVSSARAETQAVDAAPDLSGKSILITGCSSGFGRLGAEYYARRGAQVFATMRNLPRDEADQLRAFAAQEKLAIEVLEIDVLSDQQTARGAAQALEMTGGRLDVLINNAGIGITGPIEVQDMEAMRLAFDTNVAGCHRMVRALLPAMRAAGEGLIVSMSSQVGRLTVPSGGFYPSTKFALEALSEQLAYELVPHGVDVSIIQPGAYPTKIWSNRNRYTGQLLARASDELRAAYPQLTAVMGKEDGSGRTTDPMDVPRAIAEIIAMPQGRWPLRKAVHPTYRPQEAVNEACAEAQLSFLGETPFGPWVREVLT